MDRRFTTLGHRRCVWCGGAWLFSLHLAGAQNPVQPPVHVFAQSGGGTTSPTIITADFSIYEEHPLLKDKFGVYQTPFMGIGGRPSLTAMKPFLDHAGVRDLRYEIAWGKPDAFAYGQVKSVEPLTVDFTQLDPFLLMLRRCGVQPLLAATYNPLPLQACPPSAVSSCWRTLPSSMDRWEELMGQMAAHDGNALGLGGVQFEIWNEPDLVLNGSKVFFTGGPGTYGVIYRASVAGVFSQAGSIADTRIGGPAIAYDLRYVTASGMLQQPHDFLSIHAYGNYWKQIASLQRAASAAHDASPLYLTEYGSFPVHGPVNPIYSGHAAAAQFFDDVDQMLRAPDLAKVYWAQWIDDDLGMITYSLHSKAIFNAYRIYQTMLPVDRVKATVGSDHNRGSALRTMAAGDPHAAGIVVWNRSPEPQAVHIHLEDLPFATGTLHQWFIDKDHASLGDGAPEDLPPNGDSAMMIIGHNAVWTGTVQPQSLVYLHASDGQPDLLRTNQIARYMGSQFFFPAHPSAAYADFDPRTSIARLGMGARDRGTAIVANAYSLARSDSVLRVNITASGPFSSHSVNSIFGVRVEYKNNAGSYSKAVLYTSGLYQPDRSRSYPWGTRRAAVEEVIRFKSMSFDMHLAMNAPSDWNGRGILIAPLLEDAGAGSKARLRFSLVRP